MHFILNRILFKMELLTNIGFFSGMAFLMFIGQLIYFITVINIFENFDPILALKIDGTLDALLISGVLSCRFLTCNFTILIYKIISVWWGILVFSVLCSAIYWILILCGIELSFIVSTLIIFPIPILLGIYGIIHARDFIINRVLVTIPEFKNKTTVVHLSDLHLGPIYGNKFAQKIVNEIIKISPDFVVITGDLFDGSCQINNEFTMPFSQLKMPIYFVLGNHDAIIMGIQAVENAIKDTNIILIRNQILEIKIHNIPINLIGIDYAVGKNYLISMLEKLGPFPNDKANLVLYHVPCLKAEELEKYRISLYLTGHTHGGQMIPYSIFTKCLFAYARGIHKAKNSYNFVHVSQGLGTAAAPMRILSQASIDVINIYP